MESPNDFRCTHCEAEFPTWQELDDHRHSMHLVRESSGVRCPTCGAAFSTQPALDAHERDEHEVPLDETLVEPRGRTPEV